MVEALVYAYFYLVLYSFLGWICESTYVSIPQGHFVNRGFFYGPYIPIYGFGSLIALYPLLPFQNNPLIILFSRLAFMLGYGVYHQLGYGEAFPYAMVGL